MFPGPKKDVNEELSTSYALHTNQPYPECNAIQCAEARKRGGTKVDILKLAQGTIPSVS